MTTRTLPGNPIYITGAHLLDPSQNWNRPCDFLVENGRVLALGKPGELAAKARSLKAEVVNGKSLYISPGFVDLNCAIPDPGGEHRESFSSGSSAAAAGGFTSLLIKPTSMPVNDNAFITDFLLRRAKENAAVRIFPMGALTSGREGKKLAEIGAMVAGGICALGDGLAIADSYLMRKAMEYSRAFGLPVFSFPEDKNLTGAGVMNEGLNSNRLGLRGIPSAAEEIAVSRDIILARHTKSILHLQPISTKGSVEILRRAKETDLSVTAETSPQYFTLTSDAIASYDANFKCFPPLRTEEDKDALIGALADGTIDLISSGHDPQTKSSKDQAFENASAGMVGLETTFHLVMNLVQKKKLTPMRMVELLSCAPAKTLNKQREIGTLRPGALADFVLFEPKCTFIFNEKHLKGASANSPFVGHKMNGSLVATYVCGSQIFGKKKGRGLD